MDANDTLGLTAALLLALPLALVRCAWSEAVALADHLGRVAVHRQNPAALIAAASGHATATLGLGDPDSAVTALLACGQFLGALGEGPALSLVQARLAEVRARLGESDFEAVASRATSRLDAEKPR